MSRGTITVAVSGVAPPAAPAAGTRKKKDGGGERVLIILTIGAVVAGGIIGYLLRPQFSPPSAFAREIMYIKFPGE